jgi:hypothetical protein
MAKKRKKSSPSKSTPGLFDRLSAWSESGLVPTIQKYTGRIILWSAVIGVIVATFITLENYAKNVAGQRDVQYIITLQNPPSWLSGDLEREICMSLGVASDDFILDKTLTEKWKQRLSSNAWVKQVNTVHRDYTGHITLDCEIRFPIAAVHQGDQVFYLDLEGTVLPASPVSHHLVRFIGNESILPAPGDSVTARDLVAGLKVAQLIMEVDQNMPAPDRVWTELASLSLHNFEGRRDQTESHLTFYTEKNTPIRWGAAVGQSTANYEAQYKVKLANLYRQFKQTGSLDSYQYVELRNFRKERADPFKTASRS